MNSIDSFGKLQRCRNTIEGSACMLTSIGKKKLPRIIIAFYLTPPVLRLIIEISLQLQREMGKQYIKGNAPKIWQAMPENVSIT